MATSHNGYMQPPRHGWMEDAEEQEQERVTAFMSHLWDFQRQLFGYCGKHDPGLDVSISLIQQGFHFLLMVMSLEAWQY